MIILVILVDDLISGTKQKYFSHKKKANDQQTNKQTNKYSTHYHHHHHRLLSLPGLYIKRHTDMISGVCVFAVCLLCLFVSGVEYIPFFLVSFFYYD